MIGTRFSFQTLVAKTQNEDEKVLNFDISKPCQKCISSNEFVARQIDRCKWFLKNLQQSTLKFK